MQCILANSNKLKNLYPLLYNTFVLNRNYIAACSLHWLCSNKLHDSISLSRTKRVWKPNIVRKTYYSEVLEQKMRFQFSTHALRCIDKAGGFDNYIINTKEKWLHSRTAIELKHLMFEVLKCKEQGMPMSQIKKEVFPKPQVSRHVFIPRTYDTRFYFDWKGPRKQVIFC